MKGKKCGYAGFAWVLVIIGALNWGLVGIGGFVGSNWNVINLIFGGWSWLEWLIYIVVGVSGLIVLFGCRCKVCMPEGRGNEPKATPQMPA